MTPAAKFSVRVSIALLSMIVAGVSRATTLPAKWAGSYSYRYVMEHASGAPAPAWVFDLTVKSDGSCELTWQGYQRDDDIICEASGTTNDLQICYVSFADGGTSDPSGFEPYKPGEKLMELKEAVSEGRILTKWWALNKGGALKDGARFEHN